MLMTMRIDVEDDGWHHAFSDMNEGQKGGCGENGNGECHDDVDNVSNRRKSQDTVVCRVETKTDSERRQ